MKQQMRDLQRILVLAERLRAQYSDDHMYYLLGGIVVNAEDALGALQDEARLNDLKSLFGLR